MEAYTYEDLYRIMSRLRGENGCPWDRQQTHESLRGAIIEEVYEFIDALEQKDKKGMCEELGDILMLTVFHGILAEESGSFTNADIISGICQKMIARHSHVFGGDTAESAEDALSTWDRNKQVEKSYTSATDTLKSVPRALPSLMRAQKLLSRAEKSGIWRETDPLSDLEKTLDLLKNLDVSNEEELSDKIGSILWSIADFSRKSKINADFALTNAAEKFINRFEAMENGIKE